MKASFTISGRLSGLNDLVNACKGRSFFRGSQLKKKEMRRCQWAVIAGNVPTFSTPVKISLQWIEPNRKRDLDNISVGAKFILDALVQCNRLPNDTQKWVKAIEHRFPDPDAKNPRIEIVIETIMKD